MKVNFLELLEQDFAGWMTFHVMLIENTWCA